MMPMMSPAPATIGTMLVNEYAEYMLLNSAIAVAFPSSPMSLYIASIVFSIFAVARMPTGIITPTATNRTMSAMTAPVIALLSFFNLLNILDRI